MDVLNEENNVLLLPSPIYIVGNIHGQLDDLLYLFEKAGALAPVSLEAGKPVRPQEFDSKKRFIFLGGYVDYGLHSLNTFLYLACLKLHFPQSIYLLRGSHETRSLTKQYGLYDEVVLNYGHAGLWLTITDCFDLLPVAALIDQDVFCVHGGLTPRILMLEKISLLPRQAEVPASGPLTDLLWSDPDNVSEWISKTDEPGYLFGCNQCVKFARINRLDFIARSHQFAREGSAEWFADTEPPRGYRLITIWSAPNFEYKSGNLAAIMALRVPGPGHEKHLLVFADAPADAKIRPPAEEMSVASRYFV
jgi:diadenosine tetraphosphatase ApaH/serine/threonine PP2A family protein phosphatase